MIKIIISILLLPFILLFYIIKSISCLFNKNKNYKDDELIALNGSKEEQCNLGLTYEALGDYRKAKEFYEISSNNGSIDAKYSLAFLYERGLGVPKDDNKALKLYKEASKAGSKASYSAIGMMYYHGSQANSKDILESYKNLYIADQLGYDGSSNKKVISLIKTEVPLAKLKAIELSANDRVLKLSR